MKVLISKPGIPFEKINVDSFYSITMEKKIKSLKISNLKIKEIIIIYINLI